MNKMDVLVLRYKRVSKFIKDDGMELGNVFGIYF